MTFSQLFSQHIISNHHTRQEWHGNQINQTFPSHTKSQTTLLLLWDLSKWDCLWVLLLLLFHFGMKCFSSQESKRNQQRYQSLVFIALFCAYQKRERERVKRMLRGCGWEMRMRISFGNMTKYIVVFISPSIFLSFLIFLSIPLY